jgi:hypothetical protein
MEQIFKKDLKCIGCLKGIFQYDAGKDEEGNKLIVYMITDDYYVQVYSKEYSIDEINNHIIRSVCSCYSRGYDKQCLGTKIKVE